MAAAQERWRCSGDDGFAAAAGAARRDSGTRGKPRGKVAAASNGRPPRSGTCKDFSTRDIVLFRPDNRFEQAQSKVVAVILARKRFRESSA
jgi:hypothetical protein